MNTYPRSILEAGTPAPDFILPSTQNETTSLGDIKGQPAILVFYPGDFTPVCTDQLALYNEVLPVFKDYGSNLYGISIDDIDTHHAFVEDRNLAFPLLADYEPLGAMARKYGVFDETKQTSERALFVLDAQGVIQWSYLSPRGVNPGANGILEALENLKETSNE